MIFNNSVCSKFRNIPYHSVISLMFRYDIRIDSYQMNHSFMFVYNGIFILCFFFFLKSSTDVRLILDTIQTKTTTHLNSFSLVCSESKSVKGIVFYIVKSIYS